MVLALIIIIVQGKFPMRSLNGIAQYAEKLNEQGSEGMAQL